MAECRVPVVAKVHGFCLGGAVNLIAACDIVIADKDSVFSFREVKIGMAPDIGALQRIGLKNGNFSLFNELVYTGRFFKS